MGIFREGKTRSNVKPDRPGSNPPAPPRRLRPPPSGNPPPKAPDRPSATPLKDRLSIELDFDEARWYGQRNHTLTVILRLDGEEISSSKVYIPDHSSQED